MGNFAQVTHISFYFDSKQKGTYFHNKFIDFVLSFNFIGKVKRYRYFCIIEKSFSTLTLEII